MYKILKSDRRDCNLTIVEFLKKFLEDYQNKDLRFIQALWSIGIIEGNDKYYEESSTTLEKVLREYPVNISNKNNLQEENEFLKGKFNEVKKIYNKLLKQLFEYKDFLNTLCNSLNIDFNSSSNFMEDILEAIKRLKIENKKYKSDIFEYNKETILELRDELKTKDKIIYDLIEQKRKMLDSFCNQIIELKNDYDKKLELMNDNKFKRFIRAIFGRGMNGKKS